MKGQFQVSNGKEEPSNQSYSLTITRIARIPGCASEHIVEKAECGQQVEGMLFRFSGEHTYTCSLACSCQKAAKTRPNYKANSKDRLVVSLALTLSILSLNCERVMAAYRVVYYSSSAA